MSSLGTISGIANAGGTSTADSRRREAAITSPSGTRIKFQYTQVGRTGTKRGTMFEFADVSEGYIQQHGFGSRVYPLRCYFSGDNHDLEATAFEEACYEDGFLLLEHPRYGQIDVLAFGDVNRRDDLVEEINQSVVEATFFTSLKSIYPSDSLDVSSEISAALDGFDVEAAQEFTANTSLLTEASRATFKSAVKGVLRDISAALRVVSDSTAAARREFADNVAIINLGIDTLVGQPLLLARQINDLTRAPSRALAGILSRLEGYRDLLDRQRNSAAGSPGISYVTLGLKAKRANEFQLANLLAMNAVAGSVSSLSNAKFQTKPQALSSIATLLGQFDDLVAWRDDGFVAASQDDLGGAYMQLYKAVSLTAGNLVRISFQLVPERSITLDSPRTIVDLCAELYGQIDEKLDLLITSNNLTGDEILEIPKGRTIVYYPVTR